MEILKIFSTGVLFFMFSCGSNIAPRIAPENNVTGFKVPATTVTQIDDMPYTIPAISNKPRIFIFALEFCATCQAEHIILRDIMANHSGLRPNNVEILTIMVQANTNDDSIGFVSKTGIQWDPYYQVGDQLKNDLCGEKTVIFPCVVVELPGQGVVFQKIGGASIEELQSKTGVWLW